MSGRPNTFVQTAPQTGTVLNYVAQTNPSPLTISESADNPETGSLQIVISNTTSSQQVIDSIKFGVQFGSGQALMQSTGGVNTDVTTGWTITTPPPLGSMQHYIVNGPPLDAGAFITFELYNFSTVLAPTSTAVTVAESLGGSSPSTGSTNIDVTTFPQGFYFGGLIACVQSGSDYVAVAQVNNGDTVTLTWNSSVLDTAAVTIVYSTASGQQAGTVTAPDQWVSPALTNDTVFTVSVTGDLADGGTFTAAESVAVSIRNPNLAVNALTVGNPVPAGPSSFAVNGDSLLLGPLFVQGPISGGGGGPTGPTGLLYIESLQVGNMLYAFPTAIVAMVGTPTTLAAGSYQAGTDGFLVGQISGSGSISGLVSGVSACASGGNTFTLPVSQGQGFSASASSNATTYSFTWFPLGLATAPSNNLGAVMDATAQPTAAMPPAPNDRVSAYVAVLEKILEKPIAGELRAELIAAMEGIRR